MMVTRILEEVLPREAESQQTEGDEPVVDTQETQETQDEQA